MPSPIAHTSVALLVWPALRGDKRALAPWQRLLLLGGLLFTLIAPDLDIGLNLLLAKSAFESHGGATHSFLAAVVWGVAFAGWCWAVTRHRMLLRYWLIGFAAYASHIVLDALTHGRGVMMFWPWEQRISSPIPLFFGVRHSMPYRWDLHMITVISELVFVALVWWLARWVYGRKHKRLSVAAASSRDEARVARTDHANGTN